MRLGIKNFNKNDSPHELLLTTRQNTKLRNAINNNLSTGIKLSKVQLKKLIQSGGFLGRLLGRLAGSLLKTGLPLLKSVIKPLGLLCLTAASSAIDGSIQKKIYGSGATKSARATKGAKATKGAGTSQVKLIIENEDMNNIMKIIEALENSGILLKGVTKTIENETKRQRDGFLSMFLGTLGATLLGNLLTGGKGVMRAVEGVVRAGEGVMRAGEEVKKKKQSDNRA